MPVIFLPTPPFFLAIPRRAMVFPVKDPFPQIEQRRIGPGLYPFSLQFGRPYYIKEGTFTSLYKKPWSGVHREKEMSGGKEPKSKSDKKLRKKKVTFEYYAPLARRVHLVGSFHDWNPSACPLKKGRSGKWKIELPLPVGRYEYRYLVDGVWENDQRPVGCVPNAFGSWNCVVTVP